MKKHISRILAIGLLGFMLSSCENAEQKVAESISTLNAEVIAVHDEVMPKMGTLKKLQTQLDEVMSMLPDSTSEKASQIMDLKSQLNVAHQGMMDWMHDYDVPEEGTVDPETISYLTGQKEVVGKVKTDILTSIEAAEAFLAQNQPSGE